MTFSELLSLDVLLTSLPHEDGPFVIGVRPVWSTILSRVNKKPLEGVTIGIPVAVLTDSFRSCLTRERELGLKLGVDDATSSVFPFVHDVTTGSVFTFVASMAVCGTPSTLHSG